MIEVFLKNSTSVRVKKEAVSKVVKKVIGTTSKDKKGEVSVVLVGDRKIVSLNKKIFKRSCLTDVIALEFDRMDEELLGEIFICIPQVKRNAKSFEISFDEELKRVLIHGILHTLGMEHPPKNPGGSKMIKSQEKILKSCRNIKLI